MNVIDFQVSTIQLPNYLQSYFVYIHEDVTAIVTVVFSYCTCLCHEDGSGEGMNHTGLGAR